MVASEDAKEADFGERGDEGADFLLLFVFGFVVVGVDPGLRCVRSSSSSLSEVEEGEDLFTSASTSLGRASQPDRTLE